VNRLELDEEQGTEEAARVDSADDTYARLLRRLSEQSVVKHFDAYADVPWDDPDMIVDPADPRWELPDWDPLSRHPWYQAQPEDVRARIGLHRIALNMKVGLQFESVLKRGLLEFAADLPNGAPEFRYAYHEVVEEAQHSMMFQEFVNRTGIDVAGLPLPMIWGSRAVVKLGRWFPELFFLFVLGGEDPIDFVQRGSLRSDRPVHPLLETIMRIHVTEEARHLSFARQYLKRHVPGLGRVRRHILAIGTPLILGQMAAQMLEPSRQLMTTYGIPPDVIRDAYRRDATHRRYVRDSLRKVRTLAVSLDIVTPASKLLWKAFGIWDEPEPAPVSRAGRP
jgi:hypothetical protein